MKKHWRLKLQTMMLLAFVVVLAFDNATGATFLPEQGKANDKVIEAMLSTVELGQEFVQIGDIRFRVSDLTKSGFGGARWPDGEVFLEFDAGVTPADRDKWWEAARLWSNEADVQFFQRSPQQLNHIYICNGGNDTFEDIGMRGDRQVMTIVSWNDPHYLYIIAHEIGHALGLVHEHQRDGAHSFVTPRFDRVCQSCCNGESCNSQYSEMTTENYGEYDFDSVMHYDQCGISFCDNCSADPNNCRTIEVREPWTGDWQDHIGQRDHLSALDKQGMHERYDRGALLVSNVQAVPRPPYAAMYDVTYDLESVEDGPVTVSLFVSTNAGLSYPRLGKSVSGDVGPGILPGTNRHIVWNAGVDLPNFSSTFCRLRVTADDAANLQDFAYIKPGTLAMGSPTSEPGHRIEETQHPVTLTHGLYVQTTEVTNQQYRDMAQWAYDHGFVTATSTSIRDNLEDSTQELLDLDGSCEISFSGSTFTVDAGRAGYPVLEVTWYGAVAYCDWLSLQQRLPKAYDHATWQCSGGNPYAAVGYRLPTEAEWEYTCRAGNATAFANGPITNLSCSDPNLNQIGWYCGNAGSWTHPVAQKQPNAWGLYDMHGNVWEWCGDGFRADYQNLSPTDPVCNVGWRVLRGGGCDVGAQYCRSAMRGIDDPVNSDYNYGFRPVRTAN